ncbi:MAG: asparaginase, partial [Actinomycetota bacterium]|nr:asparaginase [Actinomycetota bacterium]
MTRPGAFVPVAVTRRSGCDESIHHGAVVAIGADGALAWSAGDADVEIYPRSSLKPLQAEAMGGAGLDVDAAALAVVCASHGGRAEHLDAVRRILHGAGLSEHDLQNTPAYPLDNEAHDDAVRGSVEPSALLQNCSGKHAGMLATAVVNGWPTAGYLALEHPVQAAIMAHLARVAGPVTHVGVDGCGAPAAVVSLRAMTAAMREVAVRRGAVHHAMTAHPRLVGGPQRD